MTIRKVTITAACLIAATAHAQQMLDAPTGQEGLKLNLFSTQTVTTFVTPKLPPPPENVTEDFKRGACWAARTAFPSSESTTVVFGSADFTCPPLTEGKP